MNTRTPEMQALIDEQYIHLQNFDPEIRNGLIERPFHTENQREDIRRRTESYNAKCLTFRNFCERLVWSIIESTPTVPENEKTEELLAV